MQYTCLSLSSEYVKPHEGFPPALYFLFPDHEDAARVTFSFLFYVSAAFLSFFSVMMMRAKWSLSPFREAREIRQRSQT